MIVGWLLKVVIAVALLGFAVFEVGAPLIVRGQLDGAAHDAANAARAEFVASRSVEAAAGEANRIAQDNEATVQKFVVLDETGTTEVTLEKQARSVLLKNWDATRDWYQVRVTARSPQQ